MSFLFNVALFFIGFLPAEALIGMTLAAVFGDSCLSSKGWDIGWNPILAFIVSAPWMLPNVVVVPLLHFLGTALTKRFSRRRTRGLIMVAAPVLFLAGTLGMWGLENFQMELILPVGAAGILYGALQRIPARPGKQSGHE